MRHPSALMGASAPAPAVSVVIPAYNEAARLPKTLERSLEYMRASHRDWEIIVVDDGSSDGTAAAVVCCGLGAKLRLLRAERNCGKGAACVAGASAAAGERVLLMDADGATPLSALPLLEQRMSQGGCEMVAGSRELVLRQRPLRRQLLGRAFSLAAATCVRGVGDTQCGFKLLTRDAACAVLPRLHVAGWAFDVEMIHVAQRLGIRVDSVPVPWRDVDGSKIAWHTPAKMLADVARVRAMYSCGAWRAVPEADGEAGRDAASTARPQAADGGSTAARAWWPQCAGGVCYEEVHVPETKID